jgi:hypothetical protein
VPSPSREGGGGGIPRAECPFEKYCIYCLNLFALVKTRKNEGLVEFATYDDLERVYKKYQVTVGHFPAIREIVFQNNVSFCVCSLFIMYPTF